MVMQNATYSTVTAAGPLLLARRSNRLQNNAKRLTKVKVKSGETTTQLFNPPADTKPLKTNVNFSG